MAIRVATALLAVAATALAGSGRCAAKVGRGDLTLRTCRSSRCTASMRVPLGQTFRACEPCAKGNLLSEKMKITKEGSRYRVANTVTTGGVARTYTSRVSCGVCTQLQRTSTAWLEVVCPATTSGMCPAKVGNGRVKVKTCGDATCTAAMRVPLDEEYDYCDPCTGKPLFDTTAVIRNSVNSATNYSVTQRSTVFGLPVEKTVEVECGKCVDKLDLLFECGATNSSSGSVSAVVFVLIIAGGCCCCAAVAAAVFFQRRRKSAAPQDSYHMHGAETAVPLQTVQ